MRMSDVAYSKKIPYPSSVHDFATARWLLMRSNKKCTSVQIDKVRFLFQMILINHTDDNELMFQK